MACAVYSSILGMSAFHCLLMSFTKFCQWKKTDLMQVIRIQRKANELCPVESNIDFHFIHVAWLCCHV
jgi:hypothetical protein